MLTSYAKMFGSYERLIQFWLSLYPTVFSPRTPFKDISDIKELDSSQGILPQKGRSQNPTLKNLLLNIYKVHD